MIYLGRPYPFNFFKGCLRQVLLGQFLNTLSQKIQLIFSLFFFRSFLGKSMCPYFRFPENYQILIWQRYSREIVMDENLGLINFFSNFVEAVWKCLLLKFWDNLNWCENIWMDECGWFPCLLCHYICQIKVFNLFAEKLHRGVFRSQ